jgi:YVTN family beta-propeller protein
MRSRSARTVAATFVTGVGAAALLAIGLPVRGVRAVPRIVRRLIGQPVDAPAVRESTGLAPDETLLFNGWGLTPAGRHVPTTDMPMKMVLSPDGRTLALTHGGYNAEGLTLVDVAEQRPPQFLPLRSAWNGVAFSRDGGTIFVSGGASGKVHRFRFADGKATADGELPVLPAGSNTFLAGLAVHPETGRVYVCNEAAAQVLVIDPASGKVEQTLAAGAYPHSLLFAQGGRHLYVSNWGGRSVTLLNVADGERLREIAVGVRPNDMTLAADGRLFVA